MVSATCHIHEKLIYGFLNIKTEEFRGKLQIFFWIFFIFAKMLSQTPLSVLLFFQGGYNLSSISKSMAMCTRVLLGDPPPALITPVPPAHHSALATISEVIRYHAPYWRSLRIHSQYTMSSSNFIVFFPT